MEHQFRVKQTSNKRLENQLVIIGKSMENPLRIKLKHANQTNINGKSIGKHWQSMENQLRVKQKYENPTNVNRNQLVVICKSIEHPLRVKRTCGNQTNINAKPVGNHWNIN